MREVPLYRTVGYDPFKRQVESCDELESLMWCTCGHVKFQNLNQRHLRNSTVWQEYVGHENEPPPLGMPQGSRHIAAEGS